MKANTIKGTYVRALSKFIENAGFSRGWLYDEPIPRFDQVTLQDEIIAMAIEAHNDAQRHYMTTRKLRPAFHTNINDAMVELAVQWKRETERRHALRRLRALGDLDVDISTGVWTIVFMDHIFKVYHSPFYAPGMVCFHTKTRAEEALVAIGESIIESLRPLAYA